MLQTISMYLHPCAEGFSFLRHSYASILHSDNDAGIWAALPTCTNSVSAACDV